MKAVKAAKQKIFISYRSEDAGSTASRLFEELAREYGRESVFLDHERIEAGTSWTEALRMEAEQAAVMLILIGHLWLRAQDPETGDRKLNLPDDWVRQEIEIALRANTYILPVLLDGAPPLTERSLQTVPSITEIVSLQALSLDRKHWSRDLATLHETLLDQGFSRSPVEVEVIVPNQIDRQKYAERLRQTYDLLDLTALSQPGTDDPHRPRPKLTTLFIPQHARASRPPVSLPRDYLISQGIDPEQSSRDQSAEHWTQSPRVPAINLLTEDAGRHTVVLGDPGMGKSSLARFLVLSLVLEHRPNSVINAGSQLNRLAGLVPFLIELRDFAAREAEGKCNGFESYLGYLGEDLGLGFTNSQLTYTLKSTPTLVIFDGLDEIFSPLKRGRTVREIIGFSAQNPAARILVTSRIAGFESFAFEAASFRIITLDDLDELEIETFCYKWFELEYQGQEKEMERAHADLVQGLKSTPAMQVLAGNPMLLTVMAIVARHERLARSRIGLYAQALKVLCYNWDYRKELELPIDSPVREMTPDDKHALIQSIAWHMQDASSGLRANAVSQNALGKVMEGYFEREWSFDKLTCRRAASEMLDLLQKRNWILTARGPALFGFVHRTFLEYLCAVEIVAQYQRHEIHISDLCRKYILTKLADDSWHEVIKLVTALLPTKQAESIIDSILRYDAMSERDLTDSEKESRRVSYLAIAFQCLAEQDSRRLSQLTTLCYRALEELNTRVLKVPRSVTYGTGLAEALRTIGSDWPNTPTTKAKFSFIGGEGLEFWNALFGSIWRDAEVRSRILPKLLESPNAATVGIGLVYAARDGQAIPRLGILSNRSIDALLRTAEGESARYDNRWLTAGWFAALASTYGEDRKSDRFFLTRLMEDPEDWREYYGCLLLQAVLGDLYRAHRTMVRGVDDIGLQTLGLKTIWIIYNEDTRLRGLLISEIFNSSLPQLGDLACSLFIRKYGEYDFSALVQTRRESQKEAFWGTNLISILVGYHDLLNTEEQTVLDQLRHINIWHDYKTVLKKISAAWPALITDHPTIITKVRQIEDSDERREALEFVNENCGEFAATRLVTLRGLLEDGDRRVRNATVEIIKKRPLVYQTAMPFLISRSIDNDHADCRRAALDGWACLRFGGRWETKLLRQDFQEDHPAVDPIEPLTRERIISAARALGKVRSDVQEAYATIACAARSDLERSRDWFGHNDQTVPPCLSVPPGRAGQRTGKRGRKPRSAGITALNLDPTVPS
jgi:hypothetical protein